MGGFLTVGVSAALRQLLEFGLFHGDPHPGNIFVMRDGRIAYVDFGNVAVLSQVKYIEGRKFPRCNLLPYPISFLHLVRPLHVVQIFQQVTLQNFIIFLFKVS